ncbi:MAG: hypothetical protein HYX20_04045 [Candidatus Yanofskybacteria bacterium]|nr:hypothetical protein [Candidatus Yanofskybacteria bacterium]
MRLLVAAITFGITIGGLFLFENYKTPPKEENYAQIVQNLQNQGSTKTPALKPANKSNKPPNKTLTPSPAPSFTTIPVATLLPVLSTPLPTPTPLEPTATNSSPPLTGQTSSPTPTITLTPNFSEENSGGQATPTPQPTQQNDEIIVVSLIPSPVKQNDTVKLDIKTAQETQCALKVTLPSGSQSTAKGLEDKTADNSGVISWSWKINWNTTPGTANIDINCSKNEQSFSKSLQMVIIER